MWERPETPEIKKKFQDYVHGKWPAGNTVLSSLQLWVSISSKKRKKSPESCCLDLHSRRASCLSALSYSLNRCPLQKETTEHPIVILLKCLLTAEYNFVSGRWGHSAPQHMSNNLKRISVNGMGYVSTTNWHQSVQEWLHDAVQQPQLSIFQITLKDKFLCSRLWYYFILSILFLHANSHNNIAVLCCYLWSCALIHFPRGGAVREGFPSTPTGSGVTTLPSAGMR